MQVQRLYDFTYIEGDKDYGLTSEYLGAMNKKGANRGQFPDRPSFSFL
jgi:hypothetical protein